MSRGQSSTAPAFAILAVGFVLIGALMLLGLNSAYNLDEGLEGIGFREAAVLETYSRADSFVLYNEVLLRFAAQDAFLRYYADSVRPSFEESACGRVGTYPAWNSEGSRCFEDDVLSGGLRSVLSDSFRESWNHPTVSEPPSYTFTFEDAGEGLVLRAESLDELFLPVLGVKGGSAGEARRVAAAESLDQELRATFEADSSLDVSVVSDPSRAPRQGSPDRIVIHYTAGSSAEGAIRTLREGGLSAHYVVGRDGSVTQMVPEGSVAYHAGGCVEDKCAQEGMNARSIGIEVVNLGWYDPSTKSPVPLLEDGCAEEGYVEARRTCSYEAYDDVDERRCRSQGHRCWQSYPEEQLSALARLVADISSRHGIALDREHVIGHEEVKAAKSDPGPAFPWSDFLAAAQGADASPVEDVEESEGGGCFSDLTVLHEQGTSRALELTQDRLEQYGLEGVVAEASEEHELPAGLLAGTLTQESMGDPEAVSSTGCAGIAQFCYATARDPRFSEYFEAGTVESCSCDGDGSCRLAESSCSPSDDRFDPEQSIRAAAKYLGILLGQFDEYEGVKQVYLAAQAYNTGPGRVAQSASACDSHEGFVQFRECVEDELRPDRGVESLHGRKVLSFMAAHGGDVEGLSGTTECEGVRLKNLGRLSYDPSFSVRVPDAATPFQELVDWAEDLVGETVDGLDDVSADGVPGGWAVEEGFCEDGDSLINRFLLSLQRCSENGQSGCDCPLALPDLDEYQVVFSGHGVWIIELEGGDRAREFGGAEWPTPLVDGERYGAVRLTPGEEGFLVEVADDPLAAEDEWARAGVTAGLRTVEGELRVVTALNGSQCLPVAQRRAYCAVNDGVTLAGDEGVVHPRARFGLVFNDSVVPSQAVRASLRAPESFSGSLEFSFYRPPVDDLSGVFVHCSRSDALVTPERPETLVERIPASALDPLTTVSVGECGGSPVTPSPGASYTVWVESFDYGANRNEVRVQCGNMASFSFSQELVSFLDGGSGGWSALVSEAMSCPELKK